MIKITSTACANWLHAHNSKYVTNFCMQLLGMHYRWISPEHQIQTLFLAQIFGKNSDLDPCPDPISNRSCNHRHTFLHGDLELPFDFLLELILLKQYVSSAPSHCTESERERERERHQFRKELMLMLQYPIWIRRCFSEAGLEKDRNTLNPF